MRRIGDEAAARPRPTTLYLSRRRTQDFLAGPKQAHACRSYERPSMNVACTFAHVRISNVIRPVIEASNLASLPCDALLECCGIDPRSIAWMQLFIR